MKTIFDKPVQLTEVELEKINNTPVDHVMAVADMRSIVEATMESVSLSKEKTRIMYRLGVEGKKSHNSKKFLYEPMFAFILHDRYNFTLERCIGLMRKEKALETCYELFLKEKELTSGTTQTVH